MITKQLFKRAATLAAQGQFTTQESTAVLRHMLITEARPNVFDALLLLAPLHDPIILLRFLKAYRRDDIIRALALLKECGRGDLSSTELATLTMLPERVLPSDKAEHFPPKRFPLSDFEVAELREIVHRNHRAQKSPEQLLAESQQRDRLADDSVDPVILPVDTKWSGLVSEPDNANNQKALESEVVAAPVDSAYQWLQNAGVDTTDMTAAEAAILEEEMRAVEAFEKAQQERDGNTNSSPVSQSEPPRVQEDRHDQSKHITSKPPSDIEKSLLEAESLIAEHSVNDPSTDDIPNPNQEGSGAPSPTVDIVNEAGLDGTSVRSSEIKEVPVCPPLPPTPAEDFDKFFRKRIEVAAQEIIRLSRKGSIAHEKFFILGKTFAQMQQICPEALQQLVDRGIDILGKVLNKNSKFAEKSAPFTSSVPSELLTSMVGALSPSPIAITPSYAITIAASSLDFFAVVLITGSAPSYDPKITNRRKSNLNVKLAIDGDSSALSGPAQETTAEKASEAQTAESDPILKQFAGKSFTRKPYKISDGIHLIQGIHEAIHDASMAVIKLRAIATLGDLAMALRAYVMLIKTGYGTDRTIPMAKLLLETIRGHIDFNHGAPNILLPKLIALVPPVRALCSSNRFPEARVIRVKLAAILQAFIFDADDETFYRFCGVAVEPESGVYGLAKFVGQQKLRPSRILAYVDSAFHRPVPAQPRRLGSACELLRSANRRRFGMARHAVFHASKYPPRTLRDFVDCARMLSFASLHPEFFNKSYAGYDRLVYMHSGILGAENKKNKEYAALLSAGSKLVPDVKQETSNNLLIPMTPKEIFSLEIKARSMALDAASITEEKIGSKEEGGAKGENEPALNRSDLFSIRLMKNVGPYRSAIIMCFSNEPFVLNWYIKHQTQLNLNTLIVSLRTLAKAETNLRECTKQSSSQSALQDAIAQRTDADDTNVVVIDSMNGKQNEMAMQDQLATFLLLLFRHRLGKIHKLAYRAKQPNDQKTPSRSTSAVNPKDFVIRNKGAANVFRVVMDEVLSIIGNFQQLPDAAKVHCKALMSLAQRTNRANYGAVVIEHSTEFSKSVVFGRDGAVGAKRRSQLLPLNFNHLLDPNSLKKVYTIPQMIRLVDLLHEYHLDDQSRIEKGLIDSARHVTIAHWEAVQKAIRYRMLNDVENIPDHGHAAALLKLASKVVRTTLEQEEQALSEYIAEVVSEKQKEGLSSAEIKALGEKLVLPADRLDVHHQKAHETIMLLTRWLTLSPPSEHHVFSVEHVVHFFKLFCVPSEGKMAADKTLRRQGQQMAIDEVKKGNETVLTLSPNTSHHTVTRRVALSRHYPAAAFHCHRVRGSAIPADLYQNLAEQAAYSVGRKKFFDTYMVRYLMDVCEGKCPTGFDLMRKVFAANCHKKEGQWDILKKYKEDYLKAKAADAEELRVQSNNKSPTSSSESKYTGSHFGCPVSV